MMFRRYSDLFSEEEEYNIHLAELRYKPWWQCGPNEPIPAAEKRLNHIDPEDGVWR